MKKLAAGFRANRLDPDLRLEAIQASQYASSRCWSSPGPLWFLSIRKTRFALQAVSAGGLEFAGQVENREGDDSTAVASALRTRWHSPVAINTGKLASFDIS